MPTNIVYWKLTEAAPQAIWADSVAGLNNLTDNGSPSPLVESGTGVCSGTAAQFHPGQISSSLQRATTVDLESNWVEITGWAFTPNIGSGSGTPYFCKNTVFGNPDYQIFQHSISNVVEWDVRKADNSAAIVASWGAIAAGWHFFDVYDTGVEIGISIDRGAFVKTGYAGGRRVTSGDFAMGRDPGVGSFHFDNGRLSNVAMWNGLLSDQQRDYLAGIGTGNCPPPFPIAFPTNVAWQLYVDRARDSSTLSTDSYGTPTEFVFTGPFVGNQYLQSRNVVDMKGVQPGDEVYLKLRRFGGDGSNTNTGRMTAVNLSLSIPVK